MRKIKFNTTEIEDNMAKDMCKYINSLLRDNVFTEKTRQFCTWGAKAFKFMTSTDGARGLQFSVSGLIHKGRVRVWYNPNSYYFDVELLRARKDEVVEEFEDLDFEQLHNVLHQHIERTDDPEVF